MTTLSASCLAVLMVVGLQGCSAKRSVWAEARSAEASKGRNSPEKVTDNIAMFRDYVLRHYVRGRPSSAKLTMDGFLRLAQFDPQFSAVIENKDTQYHDLFQENISSEKWARSIFKLMEKITESSSNTAFSNEFLEFMFFSGALEGLDPRGYIYIEQYSLPVFIRTEDPSCLRGKIYIGQTTNEIRVTDVTKSGSFSCALIKTGDIISRIDNTSPKNMRTKEVQSLINTTKNGAVSLSIIRNGSVPFDLRVTSSIPETEVMTGEFRDDISYIRLNRLPSVPSEDFSLYSVFGRYLERITFQDFRSSRYRHINPQLKGIILDIRNNSGGYLDNAAELASLFIVDGTIYHLETTAEIKDDNQKNRTYYSKGGDPAEQVPVVVLIDGETASGAEIIAAALQDNARAVIVGSASSGSGIVRTGFPIRGEGEIRVPTSSLFSPSGRPIDKTPVIPDVCTSRFWDNPTRILEDAKTGRYDPTKLLLVKRRDYKSLSDADEAALKNLCPPRVGDPVGKDTDIEIATRLLSDPDLMQLIIRRAIPGEPSW